MKVVGEYLRSQASLLGMYALLLVVTGGSLWLHDYFAAFWDVLLFTATCLAGYLVARYFPWRMQYQLLVASRNQALTIAPVGQTFFEGEYSQLLSQEITRRQELTEHNQAQQQAVLEDFGLWLHQVKTPVAALDLMLQTTETSKGDMKAELFKINEYLQMMLHYVKSQFDSQDLLIKSVKLAPLVRETVKKYAVFFARKDLQLVLKDLEGSVITDEKWLRFILEQVLFNAIKYTQSGQITIQASQNKLTIRDTGIGILPEDLPRVFDKGYTGVNGRIQQRASGLGLYLSQQTAKKIGAALTIDSVAGQGTKVTIVFPEQFPNQE